MLRRLLSAITIALVPFSAMAQDYSDDDIKRLALEAILENPSIIMEAVALLEQQRAEQQRLATAQLLTDNRSFLQEDPNAPVLGNPDGDVVLIEFFDYNCPYCKRSADDVQALIESDPNLKVVYREWPILGEGSVFATRAALAARAQGKYEDMHWALMDLRGRAEEASVLAVARSLDLDIEQLMADMRGPEVAAHIQASMELAQMVGFTGTPSFIVGDALVPGAVPLDQLEGLILAAREE